MIQINGLCRHPDSIKEMYPCPLFLVICRAGARRIGRGQLGSWAGRVFGEPPPNRCRRVSFPGSKVLDNIYKKRYESEPAAVFLLAQSGSRSGTDHNAGGPMHHNICLTFRCYGL
jgi:hypothetical protein